MRRKYWTQQVGSLSTFSWPTYISFTLPSQHCNPACIVKRVMQLWRSCWFCQPLANFIYRCNLEPVRRKEWNVAKKRFCRENTGPVSVRLFDSSSFFHPALSYSPGHVNHRGTLQYIWLLISNLLWKSLTILRIEVLSFIGSDLYATKSIGFRPIRHCFPV